MPFILRDTAGKIAGLFQHAHEGIDEELPMNHPEIIEFLKTSDGSASAFLDLAESDAAMARVIEDLIELLILKGAISIEDLPEAARSKLSRRQQWRGSLEEALEVFGGGKVI